VDDNPPSPAPPADGAPKGKRTETVVRKYDEDGGLVSETTMTVVVVTPAQADIGGYL
jgi:hypothetical protein